MTVGADNGLDPDRSGRARWSHDFNVRLSGAESHPFVVDLHNGRTLEFTVQPMENGGMVLLGEDITERKIAQAKINHLARFDSLTGLPNRTILRSRMDNALAACSAGADVRRALHRSRPVQAGQRHARPFARRPAAASRSPTGCARSCAKPT